MVGNYWHSLGDPIFPQTFCFRDSSGSCRWSHCCLLFGELGSDGQSFSLPGLFAFTTTSPPLPHLKEIRATAPRAARHAAFHVFKSYLE